MRRAWQSLLPVLVVALASCAHLRSGRPEPAARRLAYSFEFAETPVPMVAVRLALKGDADGATTFARADASSMIHPEISRLIVRADGGSPLPLTADGPGRWRVEHAPNQTLEVVYALLASPVVATDPVQFDGARFQLLGANGLWLPADWDEGAARVAFSARGFDKAGGRFVSSLGGMEDSFERTLDRDALAGGLFVAGQVPVARRSVSGLTLLVVGDDVGLDGSMARLVDTTRSLFGAPAGALWFVRVARAELTRPRVEPIEGGAWALVPTEPLDTAALEALHLQLARRIAREGILPPDEAERSALMQGAARVLARRAAFRAETVSLEGTVADLNWAVERHWLNDGLDHAPTVDEALARKEVSRMAPVERRAELVALRADWAIRELTFDRRSLAEPFRRALAAARGAGRPAVDTDLLAALQRDEGTEFADDVWGLAVPTDAPVSTLTLYAPCLQGALEYRGPFDMGFDYEAALKSRVVQGVKPGSRAWHGGLRDGQKLYRTVFGATPASPVELTVSDGGARVDIFYTPLAQGMPVPLFKVRQAEACATLL